MLIYVLQSYTDTSGTYVAGTTVSSPDAYARVAIAKGQAQAAEVLGFPAPTSQQMTGTGTLSQNSGTSYLNVLDVPVQGGASNAAADTAAIQAAALLCYNEGGGVVQLPAATIYLTGTLLFYSGVVYQGAGFNYNNSNQIAPANPNVQGAQGTVLVCGASAGSGTFPAFWDGKSDRVSPYANSTLMTAQYIMGCGVKNVQIVNASYGIKCGGLYEASVAWSVFEHISTIGCGWGVYFENADSCTFKDICNNNFTLGAQWHVSSGNSLINLGDSSLERIVYNGGAATPQLSRYCVFGARGVSNQNGISIRNIGGVGASTTLNSYNITLPASGSTVTLTSGSTSTLAVGLAVVMATTSTSTPALVQYQTYFVQSILSGTTLTLSNKAFSTTAITFTGSGTGSMVSKGFPGLEVVGYDDGSTISGMTINNNGCESSGYASYLFQNMTQAGGSSGTIEIMGALGATTYSPTSNVSALNLHNIVTRGCNGAAFAILAPPNSVDFDASAQYAPMTGFQSSYYAQGFIGQGALAPVSPTFPGGLFLLGSNGSKTTPTPDIYRDPNGVNHIAQFCFSTSSLPQNPTGTFTWSITQGQFVQLGSSVTAISLPTASSTFVGIPIFLTNASGIALTVTPATGTIFSGGTAAASYSLPNNTGSIIACVFVVGGTYQWIRYI